MAQQNTFQGPAGIITSLVVSDLFSLSANDDEQFLLSGYSAISDGGIQVVRYDASATDTINGGFVFPGLGGTLSFDGAGVFDGTAGTGRFIAVNQLTANVRCFGATGDDSTDDTRSIQAAIDACKHVHIPVGRYKHTGLTVDVADTKITGDGRGSVLVLTVGGTYATPKINLELNASFLILRDFKLLTDSGIFETQLDHTVGLAVTNCTRATFSALMIGEQYFAHSIGVRMYGGSANWLNNITNCQINYNTIGIHGCGHSTTITGGEIQAGKHGIVQGLIDSSYDPDLTDETAGVIGASISIIGVAIEGQDYDAPTGIAYGVFWKHSHMGPIIKGCYFELIGRYDGASPDTEVTNGVAIQIGYATTGGYQVFGGSIDSCFFARTPTGVRIGRCDSLSVCNNWVPSSSQGASHFFIDTVNATTTSYIALHDNVSDPAKYINDPSSRLSNSKVGVGLSGVRGGTDRINRKLDFAYAPTMATGTLSTDAVNKGQVDTQLATEIASLKARLTGVLKIPDLYARWTAAIDETAGDVSGGSNDGTFVGTAAAIINSGKKVFEIDGSGNGISLPSIAITTGWTVCCWARYDSGSGLRFAFGKRDPQRIYLGANSGNIYIRAGTDGGSLGGDAWTPGDWKHLALRINSSTEYEGFVDGVSIGTRATTMSTTSDAMGIGCFFTSAHPSTSSSFEWEGLVDDVQIYDRDLEDSEIVDIYSFGRGA